LKVPVAIVSIALAAVMGLEAWTLSTVFDLAKHVSAIEAQLNNNHQIAKNNE